MTGAEAERIYQERSKDILRERIDELLLVQKAKELSINVDPDVSKYLADIQKRTNIADPDKFQQFVREQTGQSYEDYKADIRNNMLRERVIRQEVGGRINVPQAEVQKYYNEHKSEFVREEQVFLREILISTEGKDDKGVAAAEKKARDVVARARKGERFGDLARDNSDAVTAQQDGELGAFKRGALNPQIEKIVFDQERGYVTDPIRVANGFLILKVEEKHKPGQATLEEVQNQIMDTLFRPRMEPAVREYLTKLRQDAFLEIKDGYVDTAPAPGKNTAWSDPAQLKPETVTKEEVAAKQRRRRLLWMVPIPGSKTTPKSGTSSSK
jgi:parvulin-like peptidyl-prolyl isomerase